MGKECRSGQMGPNIRENGMKERPTGKESLFMLMGIYTMVNGRMIRLMVMEFTSIAMGLDIKVIGRTIYNAAMVNKSGRTAANTKDCIKMEGSMVSANIYGQMAASIRAVGSIIKYKVMESIYGLMVGLTKEIG